MFGGVHEHLIHVAKSAAERDTSGKCVRRPEAAGELRRQNQALAVVQRVLADLPGVQIPEAGHHLPLRRNLPERSDGKSLNALPIVLVEDWRNRRGVDRINHVLVVGPEHRGGERQFVFVEADFAADLVVAGLLRIHVRVVLIVGLRC